VSRVNEANIGLGLGILEFGAYSSGVFQSYRNAGAIKATGTLTWTRTINRFATGRPLVTIKQEVTEEMMKASFQLAEITVANLKDAIGGGTNTSSTTPTFLDGSVIAPKGDLTDSNVAVGVSDIFEFGGQCDVAYIGLRFTNLKSCSTGKRRIFEMYKASPTGNLALPFNETDWNMYTAEFEALADTSKASGKQYGQFVIERD
jgi:hypothetical protein